VLDSVNSGQAPREALGRLGGQGWRMEWDRDADFEHQGQAQRLLSRGGFQDQGRAKNPCPIVPAGYGSGRWDRVGQTFNQGELSKVNDSIPGDGHE